MLLVNEFGYSVPTYLLSKLMIIRTHKDKYLIKVLAALLGLLSLIVGWENGPERGRKTVSFNP